MNKLEYRDGLLYTSIELQHGEKKTIVDNVIVDTGASETIILTDDDELVKSSGYGGMVFFLRSAGVIIDLYDLTIYKK